MEQKRVKAEEFAECLRYFADCHRYGLPYFYENNLFEILYHRTKPDRGQCPPAIHFFNGYCYQCCKDRKNKKLKQAALPEKIAYLDNLTEYLIKKADTRKMKKLMFIYQMCKERKEQDTNNSGDAYTFRGKPPDPIFIKVPAHQMVHIGKYLSNLD